MFGNRKFPLPRVFIKAAVALMILVPGTAAQPAPFPPSPNGEMPQAIATALARPSAPLSRLSLNLDSLRRFYLPRNYAPVWIGGADQDRSAAIALSFLQSAEEEGLPAAYRLGDIRVRAAMESPSAKAEYDLLLTAAVLDYMRDMRLGRIAPSVVDTDVALPVFAFDPVTALADGLKSGGLQAMLSSLRPPHQEYDGLKIALARYRDVQKNGGWPQLGTAPIAKLDRDDPRLGLLWRRLAVDDVALDTQLQSPATLADAIGQYQQRNGLVQTGVVDKETLAALNVPEARRIDQIVANLERWRWLTRPFAPQYIEVNTADATLKLVDRGNIVLSSRIVAGKLATPTPMFFANVVAITVNPYWNIPSTIARHEILPRERRHPGYMESQHIFFADDGSLKQQPGADNALGFLKLEMPNRFNAYLHDTPARKLFVRADRHFSHGCMRVQQIEPLASWLLTGDTAAAKEKLDTFIASGVNQRISLDRPLPVYVLYWTAIADENGSIGFRPDVYGRDSRLLAALLGLHLTGRLSLNANCQASIAG